MEEKVSELLINPEQMTSKDLIDFAKKNKIDIKLPVFKKQEIIEQLFNKGVKNARK